MFLTPFALHNPTIAGFAWLSRRIACVYKVCVSIYQKFHEKKLIIFLEDSGGATILEPYGVELPCFHGTPQEKKFFEITYRT